MGWWYIELEAGYCYMANGASNHKRVLVVDDEPGILSFVCTKLTAVGYEVVAAINGEDALREARTRPFDAVLLDLFMIPMSGFLVLDRLRNFSDVPVIIFTAHPYLAEKALRLGANDFIAKPFDPDILVSKIRRLLAGNGSSAHGEPAGSARSSREKTASGGGGQHN
jgi:DNA-binding response OmpR family regulator